MRQLLAILEDSLRESRDKRALHILLGLSALAVLFCAGISFERVPPAQLLREQVENLAEFRMRTFSGSSSTSTNSEHSIQGEIRAVRAADGLPAAFQPGELVVIEFPDRRSICRLAVSFENFYRRHRRRGAAQATIEKALEDPESGRRFLKKRFQREGWKAVHVAQLPAQKPTYRIAVSTRELDQVRSAHRMNLFFGLVRQAMKRSSEAEKIVALQQGLASGLVGILGVLVAIFACAGFIPSMLAKGSLDLVLARPIGRVRLLLYKYLGGLWFIFLLALFAIGGCWLALALRSGFWSPWFLVTIPIMVAIFAVLYTVVTLAGVLTRSGTVAGMIGIGVWWISSIVVQVRTSLQLAEDSESVPAWFRTTLDTLYAILPNTTDLTFLSQKLLARAHVSAQARQQFLDAFTPDVDWTVSLGTTAAFAVLMLALAAWRFSRADH